MMLNNFLKINGKNKNRQRKAIWLGPLSVFIVLTCFYKCNHLTSGSSVDEVEVQHITFKKQTQYTLSNTPSWIREPHLQEDGRITFLRDPGKKIFFFDLSQRNLTDSINVEIFPVQSILNYRILENDSLILFFNPHYYREQHDKVLMATNRQRSVKSFFNFEKSPTLLKDGNTHIARDSSVYMADLTNIPIVINNKENGVLVPIRYYGDYKANKQQNQLFWVFLNKPAEEPSVKLPFTKSDQKGFYPPGYKSLRGDINQKKQVIVFGNGSSPNIVKYDIRNNSTKNKRLDFLTIDTVKAYSYKLLMNGKITGINEYGRIKYDRFNQKYWRTARLGYDSSTMKPILANYPIFSILLMDTSLNKAGEGLLPVGHAPPVIPYNGGLLMKNVLASNQQGKHIFSFFTYERNKISKDSFDRKIERRKEARFWNSELSTLDYLDSVTNGQRYTNYFLIPLNSFCPPCLKGVSQSLKNDKEKLAQKDLAIIVIASQAKVHSYLQKYELSPLQAQNLYTDTNNWHTNAFRPWVNLKHIKLNGNAIEENKNYGPQNMDKLLKKIDSFDYINDN